MIGQALFREAWRPIVKANPTIVAAGASPEIERVVSMLVERFQDGTISTSYETLHGCNDLEPREWRQSAVRNIFASGKTFVNLPLLGSDLRPTGKGTARCERRVFVRKNEVDELVKTLAEEPTTAAQAEPPPAEKPAKRRGPKRGSIDRFGEADRALFSEITALIKTQNITAGEAARLLGGKIKVRGTLDTGIRRLAIRYRKEVEN